MPRNSAILYIFHTIRFPQAPIFFKSPDLVPTYAIVIQSITHTTQEHCKLGFLFTKIAVWINILFPSSFSMEACFPKFSAHVL